MNDKNIEKELNEVNSSKNLEEYYKLENSKPAPKEWTEEVIEFKD